MTNARAIACQQLKRVIHERHMFNPKAKVILGCHPNTRKRVVHECFSVLRRYHFLDAIAKRLINKPFKAKDYDLYALLLCGLNELIFEQGKPAAVVHQAVDTTKDLKKTWAKGLVNATLRNFCRQKDTLVEQANQTAHTQRWMSQWFYEKIIEQWPKDEPNIVSSSLSHPVMTLRVNQAKVTVTDYQARCKEQGILAQRVPKLDCALQLEQPVDVSALPGFEEGLSSVQDLSAQYAQALVNAEPGMHVLDACAAPGGKSAHLLEHQPTLSLDCVEISPNRLSKLEQTLGRLQLKARLIEGDAAKTDWWDGALYDRILVDAPCSGSGVIGRHPDIKVLLTQEKVNELTKTQAQLLRNLWPMLKRGGILVYVTCSIFKEENVDQVQSFLSQTPDARELAIEQDFGVAQTFGRQILPGKTHDGFYYATLIKQ